MVKIRDDRSTYQRYPVSAIDLRRACSRAMWLREHGHQPVVYIDGIPLSDKQLDAAAMSLESAQRVIDACQHPNRVG
jgi:hypothetical protein